MRPSLASPWQDKGDSAALEMTRCTWDCPKNTHSHPQTTHAEFLCHVERSEAVSTRASLGMGAEKCKAGQGQLQCQCLGQTLLQGLGKARKRAGG